MLNAQRVYNQLSMEFIFAMNRVVVYVPKGFTLNK